MTFSRFLVVGGAGFIGSHLVERLVERGPVTVLDDLSSGRANNIARPIESGRARLVQGSASDLGELVRAMQRHDVVVHLAEPTAENGERSFIEHDLALLTNVLEAMRRTGAKKLLFGSSGDVYGPTCDYCKEHDLGDLPMTAHGASKLACEAIVSGYAHRYGIRSWIFRMGEVVGPRCRRGPVVDVLRILLSGGELALADRPGRTRPYLHVHDCVEGMLLAYDRATGPVEIFNVAPGDYTSCERLVELCAERVRAPRERLRYNESVEIPGVEHRHLDPSKLDALGWETTRTSDEAIKDSLPEMLAELVGTPGHESRTAAVSP